MKYTNLLQYIGDEDLPKPFNNIGYPIKKVKEALSAYLYEESGLSEEEATSKYNEMAENIEKDLEIMAYNFQVSFRKYVKSIQLPTKG